MQKRIFLSTFVLAIFFNIATAQKTRNVFWIMPTKAEKVNGICWTLLSPSFLKDNNLTTINGLNISTDLLSLVTSPFIAVHLVLDTNSHKHFFSEYIETCENITELKINGLNIGTGSLETTEINGVNIQAMYFITGKIKGFSLTPFISKIYESKGLLISGLYNKTTIGRGVQIALINDCKDCQGVQIGLLNKMGKRTLPFINMRFKKKNAKSLLPSHANK